MNRILDKRRWLVGCLTIPVLAISLIVVWLILSQPSDLQRVEEEHGIVLPDSVDQIQALGDASNLILKTIEIDRGASSIFTLDRADLPDLLAQFGVIGEDLERHRAGRFEGAPGNSVYQPAAVPWTEDAKKELSLESPTSAGDFTTIQVFDMGATKVGVWLYTDWN